MKKELSAAVILLVTLSALIGCKKTSYHHDDLTMYYNPLQVGKYAVYQLDSLTFYYYGQLDTITHYLAKDSVEEAITDNEGRPGWRVVRYLSNLSGTAPWIPSLTFWVTATRQRLEVVENNLRFIRLAFPIEDGFSWQGNSFLPYDPFRDFFVDLGDITNHMDLHSWNYSYRNVNKSFTAGNQTYDSTVTVMQVDESSNVPIVIDTLFASKTYWSETYARNIGLVYRHTAFWEYQPPKLNGTPVGYKIGFEMTLTLLSHN